MIFTIRKNYVLLVLIIVLMIWSSIAIVQHLEDRRYYNNEKLRLYNIHCVNKDSIKSSKTCEELKQSYNWGDAFSNYYYIMHGYCLSMFVLVFNYFFVVIPFSHKFFSRIKKGNIKNILMREKYSVFLRKDIYKNYLYALFLPIYAMVMLGVSYLFSPNFNFNFALTHDVINFPLSFFDHPFLNWILVLFNLFIISCFFININMVNLIRFKNYYLSMILSFIEVISLEILLLGIQFNSIHQYRIFDYYQYTGVDQVYQLTFFYLILLFVSLLYLKITVVNKEKMIDFCEDRR